MIKVEKTELPPEKVRKIRDWLNAPECALLENCLASEIAEIQAEATNAALKEPHRTIGDPNALPPTSIDRIKESAVLQTFLDVLKKMRDENTKFETAHLTIF